MKNGKKKFDWLAFTIVSSVLLTIGLIFLCLFSMSNFRVYTDLSEAQKRDLGNMAHEGRMIPYIERYGERGPLDIDYQIETYAFASLDDLLETFAHRIQTVDVEIDKVPGITSSGDTPSTGKTTVTYDTHIEDAVRNGTPRNGTDVTGKKVKVYEISYPDRNGSDSDENDWSCDYSVFEYPDGTYRYVVNVWTH